MVDVENQVWYQSHPRAPAATLILLSAPLAQVSSFAMSYVLPGEFVPAQHVNLKLGPGLLQVSDVKQTSTIISTKAGELRHAPNKKLWWIESNSRRVSASYLLRKVANYTFNALVCSRIAGSCHWRCGCTQRRKLASRHWFCSYRLLGRPGF